MKTTKPMERDCRQELLFYLEHVSIMYDDDKSLRQIRKVVKQAENETIASKKRR